MKWFASGGRSRIIVDQYTGNVLLAEGSRTAAAGTRMVIINRAIQIGHGHLPGLELMAEFLVLAFQPLVAAKMIDGAMLGGSHKPGARIVRNA